MACKSCGKSKAAKAAKVATANKVALSKIEKQQKTLIYKPKK